MQFAFEVFDSIVQYGPKIVKDKKVDTNINFAE